MANIKVAVRIRPISEREINVTGADIVVHTDGNELSLTNLKVSSSKAGDSRKRTRRYGFDYCFNSSSIDSEINATQEKVYEKLGRSALDALFSGFNACLVAYGQSASGKTYTMMGPKGDPGLTPRLCEGLFLRIFEAAKTGDRYETAVSYLEIYNERVRDLLKPSTPNSGGLRVREHPRLGPYVQGLTRHTVSTLGSLMSYVEEGTRARKTASTSQNPTSSRSHALLTVSLTSRSENSSSAGTTGLEKKQHGARGARLHLVDLAGSERAGNSNYGLHRLKEGANINKSLVALGNVISALAERGATGSGPGRRFIPYRDSALTWLLKDALGGNATTIMLATISPASGSYNETAHTLRFAQRAQSVVNRPVVNEDPVARVIRELRAEISRLTLLLSEKGPSGEEGSFCCCKRRPEIKELPGCGPEDREEAITSGNDEEPKSNKLPEIDDEPILPRGSLSVSTLHRRFSSDESLSSNRLLEENEGPTRRRSGSLKSLDSFSEETVRCAKGYDRARVSSVCYDGVNALALVDIPTLVAVLIKPDDNQSGSAQIEEISGENILEDSVDTGISGSREVLEFEGLESGRNDTLELREVIKPLNDQTRELEVEVSSCPKEDGEIIDENSELKKSLVENGIIDLTEGKTSSSLKSSKRFGSSESFDAIKRIDQGTRLVQRSYTTLQPERSRQLNGVNPVTGRAKRTWSPRGSTWSSSRKVDFGEKDAAKKSTTPDVERSQEVKQQKTRNPLRKQESDSPKRKISRDSNHAGSKEEPILATAPKLVRKGSVTSEITSRTQTPIQRTNRRAEIVAAVTERLYSTKKASEEGTASPGSDQFRSPESTEVKLASTTRMKLQEISRKMLAKRRKTCVDTQTDATSTVRVKDTASITDSTEVERQDAAVMTELHEDCRGIGDSHGLSVTRVKDIATLTERFARAVRCRDVGIVTEDYEDDEYQVESLPDRKLPSFAEAGTTTKRLSQNRSSASQTLREEGLTDSKNGERGCRGCHNVRECCYQVSLPSTDRNVICITLPDMLSVTIESPNGLESKIAVTEGTATLVTDEKVIPKVKNAQTQTESREKSPTTDDPSSKVDHVMVNDVSTTVTTRSAACQSDGKTFRIENIFKDPKCTGKLIDRTTGSDLLPDLTEHVVPKTSLKLTNSVGTSFTPDTTEQSTEIDGLNFFDQRATGQSRDSDLRELPNLKFSGLTFKRSSRCNDFFERGFIPSEFPSSPPPAPIPVQQTDDGSKFQTQPLLEDEPVQGTNTGSIPRCIVTKIEAEELKSPLLVARLISNSNLEMDSSFSDDSLDPDELSSNPVSKSFLLRLDDALCPPDVVAHTKKDVYESRVEEDFADEEVEFPRSSVSSESTTSRVHDYESLVLGRNCFVPIRQDSGDIERIETPSSEESRSQSKKKVSFSNSKLPDRPQVNETRKPKPIIKNKLNKFTPHYGSLPENDESEDSRSNHSPRVTKLNSSTPLDCSPNSNGFTDDISSISGSSETIRSGTLYNSDEDSDVQLIRRKREESDMKRVRFTTLLFSGERGDSGTSDSDGCENTVSDEEGYCCERNGCEAHRSVFASYLNEATAFVHNMNTINDQVNASRMYLEKEKHLEEDYIEYQGCKISLRDDTDEYLKQEDFQLPLDSYKNCLTGIAKLENCIERAVRHDKLLLDKYGIRLESATTSYSLVDPGKDSSPSQSAGIHFENSRRRVPGFRSPVDLTSSVEDLVGITDEEVVDEERQPRGKEDPSDLENAIFEHLMDSANTRRSRSAKPYFRRSTRMSDLSGKGPTSYSRFRRKYSDLGSYPDRETLEDSKWYTTTSTGLGTPQSSPEVMKDTELKVPQCFLMVPDSGKPSSGTEYRSDGGTSSSDGVGTSSESIDTVASVRNKFRYPGSPRAKLLQLVSERRQIVHRSRNGSPS